MNIDQALGYLLRDPQSVEAEAGRVLNAEILARGQEVAELKRQLERVEAKIQQWRSRRYEPQERPRIGGFALAEAYERGRNDQDIACTSELEQALKGGTP